MSDTFYNNDDLHNEIDELHIKVDKVTELVEGLTKLVEGLQSQLGNEVDALAKLTIKKGV